MLENEFLGAGVLPEASGFSGALMRDQGDPMVLWGLRSPPPKAVSLRTDPQGRVWEPKVEAIFYNIKEDDSPQYLALVIFPKYPALRNTLYTTRYSINHTEPVVLPDGLQEDRPESEPPTYPVSETGAQAQREDSPTVCDAAWMLLILSYGCLERTDDSSGQDAAVYYYVGWSFANAILKHRNQRNLDPMFRNDIIVLLFQVQRIAKQRLGMQVRAASKLFRTYLDTIGFSVGDSEDAWTGLKALDAWFEKRGESVPMSVEKVMLDARERRAIVDTIIDYGREWQRNGTALGMSFDSVGGTGKTIVFDGNGTQINYVCTGSGQQYIVEI